MKNNPQAGYSNTPLLKKLGYEPGNSVLALYAPDWFAEELKDGGVMLATALPATWAHGFFYSKNVVEHFLASVPLEDIVKGLWVSWPKKASHVVTDLTEQVFRDLILPLGWVDIKVAAIDDTWSGLKFTRRKA